MFCYYLQVLHSFSGESGKVNIHTQHDTCTSVGAPTLVHTGRVVRQVWFTLDASWAMLDSHSWNTHPSCLLSVHVPTAYSRQLGKPQVLSTPGSASGEGHTGCVFGCGACCHLCGPWINHSGSYSPWIPLFHCSTFSSVSGRSRATLTDAVPRYSPLPHCACAPGLHERMTSLPARADRNSDGSAP